MDSWTAAALTAALQRIDRSAPPGRVAGRSWLAATQDLVRELAP
jgi:hypothetical protein